MNEALKQFYSQIHPPVLACAVENYGVLEDGFHLVSDSHERICGPAATVWTLPGDTSYGEGISSHISPGAILVIDAGGNRQLSCLTQEVVQELVKAGAAGILVNGAVDCHFPSDIPIYAKSVHPQPLGPVKTARWDVPIVCGGVSISPGDLIAGDSEGFVRIARSEIEATKEVIEELIKRR